MGVLNKDLRDKEGGKTGIKFYAGDVLYGKLRPYLMNWLYPQFNGVAVGDFWVLRATECDSSFLYRLVQTDSFQRLANVSSGSKMPRADWNLISQSFFAVPADRAEQKAIAKSLAELDDLITLHQRKRCNGPFTHPLVWEQRKLGEIIQLGGSGGTPSATNPNYYGGEIPFLGIADIEGRDIAHTAKTLTEEGLRNSAAWIVPAGAVSLAMYASVGKVGIIRQDTATSQAFYNMVFEDVAIRDFVFTRLEKADVSFEWEPYISTGTQRNLNANKVKAFAIAVPGSREAAKIGRYFANLDSLITLHQ